MKMNKIDFNNLFLMAENIPTCPFCGSRTDIFLDLSHTKDSIQVHQCLLSNCKKELVFVRDFDVN